MASLNRRKPYRVVVHIVVDGRDVVTRRLRFATRAEADEAYESLELAPGEFAEVVAPLLTEDSTS